MYMSFRSIFILCKVLLCRLRLEKFTKRTAVHFNSSSYYLHTYYENMSFYCPAHYIRHGTNSLLLGCEKQLQTPSQIIKSAEGNQRTTTTLEGKVTRGAILICKYCQYCLGKSVWIQRLHIFIVFDKITLFNFGALKRTRHACQSVSPPARQIAKKIYCCHPSGGVTRKHVGNGPPTLGTYLSGPIRPLMFCGDSVY